MTDENHTRVISLGINDVVNWGTSTVYKFVEQPLVHIGHVDWILGACVDSSAKTNNVKNLGVYVKCKDSSRSNLWSCNASIRFSLVKLNSKDKNEKFDMDFEQKFDGKNKILKIGNFKGWQEVISAENQFVLNQQIVIEARITVKSVVGIYEKILKTFDTPKENLTDVVLLVEDKKIHVGKQFLAHFSDYFSSLFFGDFAENSKSEIRLEDVVHAEFVDFLNLMYPTHKGIEASNVGHLLKLADRFVVPYVLEKCENWLVSAPNVNLVDKLKYAESYRLSALQDHCLLQLKSNSEVLKLTNETSYPGLGDTTQAVLFQKLVDLLKNAL